MSRDRSAADYAYLSFTGLAMGAADVVPGVSGGTMAFIMGVYQELIDAIKAFDLDLLKKALRFDLKGVFEQVPWRFLLALGAGIAFSILSLAHAVSYLLENHQSLLYAFFFGLVLASIVTVARRVRWSPQTVLGLIGGSLLAYWIVGLVPVETSKDPFTLFLAGSVAISAMILPGISGSFILLILGKYAYVLNALKTLDIVALLPFMAGCALGLMAFARVLSWLFAHYEQITVTLLVGFMIGSLRKIWPFKVTVETMVDRHGDVVPKVQHNLMPDPAAPHTWFALGLAVLGFVLILGLERLRHRLDARRPSDA
ncbi:MAG: DUF368 domain-containing protein [Acidobacteriota bacterium]